MVVPFLNEEEHLPTFLRSVAEQTRRPDEMLLVDDGSTDRSFEIAEAFAAEHSYARAVRRPPRPPAKDRLAQAHELKAFHWGVEQLHGEWDAILKMDADLDLAPDHLEMSLGELERSPRLGIVGCFLALREPDGTLRRERSPEYHVRGANKCMPRACYEAIQPVPPILGWDTIDEIRARMHGWETRSVATRTRDTIHLRPTGAHDGRLRAYRRWGLCAWGWGAHPLYVLAGAAVRTRERPYFLAALHYVWGYAHAGITQAPRVEARTRAYARREEIQRLRAALRRRRPPMPGDPVS